MPQCSHDLAQCHEREQRYRQMFEMMNDGFGLAEIIVDEQGCPCDFRLLEVNEAFSRLTGFPATQAIGSTAHALIPNLEQRWIDIFANVALMGEPARFENYVEGLRKWFKVFAYQTTPGHFAFLIIDITERKRAEQTTTEQFKLAEAVFTHSYSCIAVLDRDYNFLLVNDAYARAAHKDVSEFPGHNHFEMYPSDAKLIFDEVVRTKRPFATFTRAFVYPDQPERGVTYWDWTLAPTFDQEGEVKYLIMSLQEVTERKLAEDALRESEARYRQLAAELELIYNTAPVGLCVLDTELRYVHINERLAVINGVPANLHLGKSVREIVPNIADLIETMLIRVLETGAPVLDFEFNAETPEQPGVLRTWVCQFWPLKDDEGRVTGINLVAEEITERRRIEEALRREREFRTLAENSTDVVSRYDRNLRRVYANPAIESIVGRPRAEILGKTNSEIGIPKTVADLLNRSLKEVFSTGQPREVETQIPTPKGDRYLEARLVPEFGLGGKVETVLAITRDITERKRAQQTLEELILLDPLTGIANRRYLEQFAGQEWRREARNHHSVALIMADIDNFKAYNDHYGHLKGDECLRQVASTLRQSFHRPADTVVRYGGEEFAILLPETELTVARKLAERLRKTVEALKLPHTASPLEWVTISLGVAAIKAQEGNFVDLVAAADAALYQAKNRGRNRVETKSLRRSRRHTKAAPTA